MSQSQDNALVRDIANRDYEYGFTTDIETEVIPRGLNEDVVRLISQKKGEPQWLLDFRLQAFRHWLTMQQPTWGHVDLPPIDYQAISYYADPRGRKRQGNSGEIDPELQKTFDKLGIPLNERLALSADGAAHVVEVGGQVGSDLLVDLDAFISICSPGDVVGKNNVRGHIIRCVYTCVVQGIP